MKEKRDRLRRDSGSSEDQSALPESGAIPITSLYQADGLSGITLESPFTWDQFAYCRSLTKPRWR